MMRAINTIEVSIDFLTAGIPPSKSHPTSLEPHLRSAKLVDVYLRPWGHSSGVAHTFFIEISFSVIDEV